MTEMKANGKKMGKEGAKVLSMKPTDAGSRWRRARTTDDGERALLSRVPWTMSALSTTNRYSNSDGDADKDPRLRHTAAILGQTLWIQFKSDAVFMIRKLEGDLPTTTFQLCFRLQDSHAPGIRS